MNKDRIIDQLNEVYGNKTPMTIEQLLMRSSKEFLVKYLMFLDQELCKHQKALDKACETIETYDTKGNYAKVGWTKDKWKEWYLKDE